METQRTASPVFQSVEGHAVTTYQTPTVLGDGLFSVVQVQLRLKVLKIVILLKSYKDIPFHLLNENIRK